MVAVPVRLPVTTPSALTVAILVLLDLYLMVPTVPEGSSTGVSCSFSFTPMEVRLAESLRPLGAGATLTVHSQNTPLWVVMEMVVEPCFSA